MARKLARLEYIIFLFDILVSLNGVIPPNTNHLLLKLEYFWYFCKFFAISSKIMSGIGNILFEFLVFGEEI